MEGSYVKIYDLAKPYLSTRDNDIHTKISYSFARRLCDAEKGNECVVLPAIILHDVGWIKIPEELHPRAFGPGPRDTELNRIHEVEGAKIARKILEVVKYSPDLTEEIVEIVLGHDSRKEPVSINDAIVKDADKLWRFSDYGFEVDVRRFKLDPAGYVAWLEDQIESWFITQAGKAVARKDLSLREQKFGKKKDREKGALPMAADLAKNHQS